MILGFLSEGPQHGYELRRRMSELQGHARSVSDGTVYPAIKRLLAAGALTQETVAGTAASRRVLTLTRSGRERLEERLRSAAGHDVTDGTRFSVVLSFLSRLPDEDERRSVLRHRLEFLDQPVGFFYEGGRPVRLAEIEDPYRRGMMRTARATRTAEMAWLREELGQSDERGGK
jgi:DNA-binding PadR family transcriptional regulator